MACGSSSLVTPGLTETLTESCNICDQLIKLRDNLKPDQFETAVDRLKSTLEKLTGATWDMVEATNEVDHGH